MTTVRRLDSIPTGYEYVSPAPLNDYDGGSDADAIAKKHGAFDLAVYWYGSGSYEGSGQMLLKKGGRWHHQDLGHCSCYGPLATNRMSEGLDSLDALLNTMSCDLRKRVEPLLPLIPQEER